MSIHFTSDNADESPDGTANAPSTILSNINTRNQFSSDKSYLEEVEVKWRYTQEYPQLGSYWYFENNLPAWPNGIPLSEDIQALLDTLPGNKVLSNPWSIWLSNCIGNARHEGSVLSKINRQKVFN